MHIVSYEVSILICQEVAFAMFLNMSYTDSSREGKIERDRGREHSI